MIDQEPTIMLSIQETGTADQAAFISNISVDGNLITSNHALSPDESQAVRNVSHQ